jgi:hypothetical protein
MAGEEQLLVAATAKAEPEECSRWAVTCLLGGAGAALLCVSFYLVNDSEIMRSSSGLWGSSLPFYAWCPRLNCVPAAIHMEECW